jgi:hypothetical protein
MDAPMILNKNDKNYNMDNRVRAFYANMLDHGEIERSNHIFNTFGCDMAYIDAKTNYKIMDELIIRWNELGFNKTIELKYSTPTEYVKALSEVNNGEWNKTGKKWPIRKDDMFPYSQNPNRYWNGYYTSRP